MRRGIDPAEIANPGRCSSTAPATEPMPSRASGRRCSRPRPALPVGGGGTKPALTGRGLDVAGLRGLVEYDPAELTFTALAGTPLRRDRQPALAEHGQYLPFNPPWVDEAGASARRHGRGGGLVGAPAVTAMAASAISCSACASWTAPAGSSAAAGRWSRTRPTSACQALRRKPRGAPRRPRAIDGLKVSPVPAAWATLRGRTPQGGLDDAVALMGHLATGPFERFEALDLEPPGTRATCACRVRPADGSSPPRRARALPRPPRGGPLADDAGHWALRSRARGGCRAAPSLREGRADAARAARARDGAARRGAAALRARAGTWPGSPRRSGGGFRRAAAGARG